MTSSQDKVSQFIADAGLHCPAAHRLLDMQSELGEVCKEILKATDYGAHPMAVTDALRDDLGDLLFSLLAFAAENDINADAALDRALAKYRDRLQRRGSAGSGGA